MFEIVDRVGASKTGADGRLKLVSAIDIMQDCSFSWIDTEPVFRDCLKEQGWYMLLASRQVDFYHFPPQNEELTVKTWIYEIRKSLGYRNTIMYDSQDRVCAASWCVGAFVDRDTNAFVRLPEAVEKSVTLDERYDMEYLPKKIKLAEAFEDLPCISLRRSDIDINNHVNNARYIEIACEVLPDDFVPRRMRVEYKNAAVWGDVIYPQRAIVSDERYHIKLSDKLGNPYAILEFTR